MIETLAYDPVSAAYREIPSSAIPQRYKPALATFCIYRSRRLRRSHPDGSFDSAGRWYPSVEESRPCCRRVRTPSRAWPLSLNMHCRTAGHIAALCNVDVRLLRGLILWTFAYCRDTVTAPDLCGSCGASWPCEHRPWWDARTDDPSLMLVPDSRADMDAHLGGMNR